MASLQVGRPCGQLPAHDVLHGGGGLDARLHGEKRDGQVQRREYRACRKVFGQLLADPVQMTIYMLIIVAIGVITTRAGVKNGVERVTKVMMVALFVVLVALCVRAVTLPGAEEGLEFYLMPDFGKLFAGNTPAEQWATFGDAVYAALGQAFFTVSVGIGAMAIFGSYIGKDRASQARPCAWACSTRWLRSWRHIIFPRVLPTAWSRIRGRRLCSSRCPSCSTRCPWGSCGARCSSCS